MIRSIFAIALVVAFTSCTKQVCLGPSEYKSFLEDEHNGLISKVNKNDFEFSMKVKPLDIVTAQELRTLNVSQHVFDSLKKTYDGLQYFTLEIGSKNKKLGDLIKFDGQKGKQDSIAEYVHFYMQRDFMMISENDTVPCVLFHLEQGGNISPHLTISLAFEKLKQPYESEKIFFNDKIFGTGESVFSFSQINLNNIPPLKLNS